MASEIPSTSTAIKRFVSTVVSGFVVAALGTGLHRSGADRNLPWGLLLALALVFFGAWLARRRMGVIGLGFHLIVSSMVVWFLASTVGPGGDILVGSSPAFVTFFSANAGVIWILGTVVVQIAVLIFPKKFFENPSTDNVTEGE